MKSAPADKRLDTALKKPYSPPALVVYGDLTRITQSVTSMAGSNDGMNNKTG